MFKKFIVSLIIISFLFVVPCFATNDWTTNPYVIDATEDSTAGGNIQAIEFHPGAADDDAYVLDGDGNVLFKCRAPIAAANNEAEAVIIKYFIPPRNTEDIDIETIDGGTIYIHTVKTW